VSQISELQEKVSAKFEEIFEKHRRSMSCAISCHSCCKPGISVSRIEAKLIQSIFLQKQSQLEELKKANPHKGKRCEFLDAAGACAIYDVRPVICRSHGAPIQYRDPNGKDFEKAERYRDACELNFKGISLKDLPLNDIFNIDTVNTLLSLLQAQEFGKQDVERFPLSVEGIARA
jgi:Fe-S-cluster containining protein